MSERREGVNAELGVVMDIADSIEAVAFDNMLSLIDRAGRKPKTCPACGSSVLATLIPWDFPFTEAVRRAQDACRAAYQRKHPPTGPTPVWRCLDCGAEIPIDPTREA